MEPNWILVAVRKRSLRRFIAFGGGAVAAAVAGLAAVVSARTYPRDANGDYVASGLLFLLTVYLLVRGVRPWKDLNLPEGHQLIQNLEAWGDPASTALSVEQEGRTPKFRCRDGWSVTDRFVIRSTFFTFSIFRLEDLLWAYERVTKHSVNFIPTGTTWEAMLICNGGSARIRSDGTRALLAYVAETAPWAFVGYSEELARRVRRHPDELYAAVAKRRRAHLAAESAEGDLHSNVHLTLANAMNGGKAEVDLGNGRRVRVVVPPGVSSGLVLRVPGLGKPRTNGASSGDLHVHVHVAADARFARRADDLETRVRVSSAATRERSTAQLNLPDGTTTIVEIPAGTQNGARLTVAGHGMPKLGGPGRGDLHVVVEVSDSATH